jgi:hypothetical protein
MSFRKFISNPYMDGIYRSFLGSESDESYYQRLEAAVLKRLGAARLEVQKLECGVGLAILCRVDDDSLVHLKIIKGTEVLGHQTECSRIQTYLTRKGFPCTVPIGLPLAFGDSSLQFEEYYTAGEYRDSHDPKVMDLQAERLVHLNYLLSQYESDHLGDVSPKIIPRDRVWRNPPQDLFSFDRHQTGDELIKEKALSAKVIFEAAAAQDLILSHEDWSNKHFRFLGDRVSVIYDWDSLTRINELHCLGLACSTFTATWYFPTKIFPSKEEAKSFVRAYSSHAGKNYSSEEMRIISSYAAYTLAYIARCAFAFNGGSIRGNDVEEPFNDIQNGLYF